MRPRRSWLVFGLLLLAMAVMCRRACGRIFRRMCGGCAAAACLVLLVAAAASAAPARIALARQAGSDGSTHIVATVTDGSGNAVEGSGVSFLAKTAFGWLPLGEVDTTADGRAEFVLPADTPYAEVLAQSAEEPDVRAGILLSPTARPLPAKRPGLAVLRGLSPQPGFLSPYPPVQILFVAALLGGIWTTYAYLVSLLIRIRRAP